MIDGEILPPLPPVPLADQILSVKREIAMRKGVYPKWVDSGRMKLDMANEEIRRMEAVLTTLEGLVR